MEALAKALVAGNRRLDQLPSCGPLLAQIVPDLDKRTGEQIARHDHLLSNSRVARTRLERSVPGESNAFDRDAVAVAELQCAGAGRRVDWEELMPPRFISS